MRIGFVTDSYKPYVSGVTNFISLNRRYLEAQGHETFVFAFNEPPAVAPEPRITLSPGVPVRGTDGFRLGVLLTPEARSLLATMDVVHVDDPFCSGRLAAGVCRRQGIPVVFTNHTRIDLYPDYYIPGMPAGTLARPVATYLRRFCRESDLVISPTETMASVLRELGVETPITVARNGVDIERFRSAAFATAEVPGARASRRTEFGAADDDVVFVYSGRLNPEKNLGVLIEAFSAVAREVPARLVLVGDGPIREELERMAEGLTIADRVFFTGMVPYEHMGGYIAPCDVWVSASVSEVDPLSLIEAMAAGLPSVTFDAPGMRDTVQAGVTGLLAKRADSAHLAEQMLLLCLDRNLRIALGSAAQQVAASYSIQRSGARMLGLYETVVDVSNARRRTPEMRTLAVRRTELRAVAHRMASPDSLRRASLLARRTTTFLAARQSRLTRRARSAFIRSSRRALRAFRSRV